MHYGIPYPRLHHAPQFPKRYVMEKPQMPDGPQHATGCAPYLPLSHCTIEDQATRACTQARDDVPNALDLLQVQLDSKTES